MVKHTTFFNLLILLSFPILFGSFTLKTNPTESPKHTTSLVNWMTWEEAVAANKRSPRKIIVDVYTTWCGPCKKMDKVTFNNPKVAQYINDNFYAVKFDAEQHETITYDNHQFMWKDNGRNGVHELAVAFLNGRLNFPTVVFFDEKITVTSRMPGYMDANDFGIVLKYHKEEKYKTTQWNTYFNNQKRK